MADDDLDDDEMPDRLFRERRLLLAVSVVLLAHQWLGITVEQSADTLGLHFKFADPQKLWWAVWAVWLWAAACYIQQFNSLKLWLKYPQGRHYETRDWLIDRDVLARVRSRAFEHLRSNIPPEVNPKFDITWVSRNRSVTGLTQRLCVSINVRASWTYDGNDMLEARASAFDAAAKADGWLTSGGSISRHGETAQFEVPVTVPVLPAEGSLPIRGLTYAWTLLSTPYFTDYFAPVIVGVAPLIIAIIQATTRWMR